MAKPDQLIKRRGKAGLLALNKSWTEARQWIADRAGKPVKVSSPFSSLCLESRRLVLVLEPAYMQHGKHALGLRAGHGLIVICLADRRSGPPFQHFLFMFVLHTELRLTISINQVEKTTGVLTNFIVEPFLPHPSHTEFYICVTSAREGDTILFTHEGGVEVGDVDAKALKLDIPVGAAFPPRATVASTLLTHVTDKKKKETLIDFITRLYAVYVDLHFAYLEINPLICLDGVNGGEPVVQFLDMAAKLDQTAESICGPKWAIARDVSVGADSGKSSKVVGADRGPPMAWPAPFGRQLTREEAYIQKLDGSTGASLKLTVLNPEGRVWTMVAG